MMRKKRPRTATLDEVRISKDGWDAVIEFLDPDVSTTHLTLGPDIQRMTDQEILDKFNQTVDAMKRMAAESDYVPIEIPVGRPQVEYSEVADQWTPRGDVLRCVIDDAGPDGEVTIDIDDREFSLAEFGRMLSTYAGWGMRITFVPDDALEIQPPVEVRQPDR